MQFDGPHPAQVLQEKANQASFEITNKEFAHLLDREDELNEYRDQFFFPKDEQGVPYKYFTGNSLGLQHRDVKECVDREVFKWRDHGVEGHFQQPNPWFEIDEVLRDDMASIVGANRSEVVVMNSLTANLHLLLSTFYRPEGKRTKLLAENLPFPSDTHAFVSQVEHHNLDPKEHYLTVCGPGQSGSETDAPTVIPTEAFLDVIEKRGEEISVLVLGAVQFLTGQFFDIKTITEAAHKKGIIVGVDCAHAVGNVPLELHDWDVDFACWCTYKYLNGGPGNIGGLFVHDRLTKADGNLHNFKGWWGHRVTNRFSLHKSFDSSPGAACFQLSNPCVISIMSLAPSVKLCARIGMPALRKKSVLLTGYLEMLLKARLHDKVQILTPSNPAERGAQLSISLNPGVLQVKNTSISSYENGTNVDNDSEKAQKLLLERGVICDNRPPNIIRVAPAPTYVSFEDVHELVERLASIF